MILATIAFFSEEFTRRREHRRQQAADEQAEQSERDRLQREADLVLCDARPVVSHATADPRKIKIDELQVEVENRKRARDNRPGRSSASGRVLIGG